MADMISGINIPDSKIAREAAELVRQYETEMLFNHSVKAYPADSGSSICSRGADPARLALFAWIVSLDDVPIARGLFVGGEPQQRFE